MKAVLICESRIDCLNSDGQECMESIISEKMGECFCILCASAFFVFKAGHALWFSEFKIQVLQKFID